MSEEIALITAEELSLVENSALNTSQLQFVLSKTPSKYVRKRPAKGGGEWEYVSGGYVKKCLNLMFGFNWDFEITNQMVLHGEAIVQGKLTCKSNGQTIVKTQFGNKDIIFKKQSSDELAKGLERIPLSIGNDLKAAATDCLKKCAAEIGIAADIYNKLDFREVDIATETDVNSMLWEIKDLYSLKIPMLSQAQVNDVERIINNKEVRSYKKLLKTLRNL
jgi:hypothetical protein